jgi:hypothetical protein
LQAAVYWFDFKYVSNGPGRSPGHLAVSSWTYDEVGEWCGVNACVQVAPMPLWGVAA